MITYRTNDDGAATGTQMQKATMMQQAMRTHRFGQKLKLPATIAIKHQLRTLMYLDSLAKAEKAERELKQSADLLVQPSRGVEAA